MSIARFEILGRFDGHKVTRGTLAVDRETGLISVRPHRRRKVYQLPASFVAEIICQRCIRAEVNQKKKERELKRRQQAAVKKKGKR